MVIRGNIDLLNLDLPDEERRQTVLEAGAEAERMSRLTADLLFLAEADSHDVVEEAPVALRELVSEVWEQANTLDAGSHELLLDRNDPVTVQGDYVRPGQLLWNLVENALRYAPAGGRVTLSLRDDGQFAELLVADTGIGIPPEHAPRISERFYRVDPSRSCDHGGTRLGLAIVKRVTEAHGRRVQVRSTPGVGTTFGVCRPVRPPRPALEAESAEVSR